MKIQFNPNLDFQAEGIAEFKEELNVSNEQWTAINEQ